MIHMKKTIAYLAVAILTVAAAQAQGVSNARDGNGNLVDRGAATRTYTSTPMANSHVIPQPAHGSVSTSRHTGVIPQR